MLLINVLAYSLPPAGVDEGRKDSASAYPGARSNWSGRPRRWGVLACRWCPQAAWTWARQSSFR